MNTPINKKRTHAISIAQRSCTITQIDTDFYKEISCNKTQDIFGNRIDRIIGIAKREAIGDRLLAVILTSSGQRLTELCSKDHESFLLIV